MAVASNKTRVMITFADATLSKIDEICNQTGLSRTEYVNMLVHVDVMERKKEEKQKNRK